MTRRLSDWSKPGEKPPMVGVWETDFCNRSYQHWNGEWWGYASEAVDTAYENRGRPSYCCAAWVRFRGLADKPE